MSARNGARLPASAEHAPRSTRSGSTVSAIPDGGGKRTAGAPNTDLEEQLRAAFTSTRLRRLRRGIPVPPEVTLTATTGGFGPRDRSGGAQGNLGRLGIRAPRRHRRGPRANAPRVDVKQREPVPDRKGGTRVDVPTIGEPLHLVHHKVPMHQGPKARDRPAAVAANNAPIVVRNSQSERSCCRQGDERRGAVACSAGCTTWSDCGGLPRKRIDTTRA